MLVVLVRKERKCHLFRGESIGALKDKRVSAEVGLREAREPGSVL